MDSVKIWNRIVKHYKDNYTAKEEVLQKDWERIFSDLFKYSSLLDEIDAHRTIHIGAGKRTIPDIIICGESGDLFDVELKQYNHPFMIEMENQLKSYLDLLHISVGILICQSIYLYVYDFSKSKLKRIEISFKENNPDGIRFVELIRRGQFSPEAVEEFIDSKIAFKENVERIKSLINGDFIRGLIIEHFRDEFDLNEINAAINNVDLMGVASIESSSEADGVVLETKTDAANNDLWESVEASDVYSEPSFDYVIIKTSKERIDECGGSLYDATRFAWRAGPRVVNYKYVLSVVNGIVQEVYFVNAWNIVDNGPMEGRYEFQGVIANSDEARGLIGKLIPNKYRKLGAANPLQYKKE